MCGLIFVKEHKPGHVDRALVADALASMSFRGPDGEDTIFLDEHGAALGHIRLQIIGGSEEGHQPMRSWSGRYFIVFNGEIYNYQKLARKYFPGSQISSDTRLLLELLEARGMDALHEVNGMFAFVLFDLTSGEWIAARDRFGIKPLFVAENSSRIVITSEVVSALSFVGAELDELSLAEWRKFRRPCPGYTFYRGVAEVLPGCFISSRGHDRWYRLEPQADTALVTSERFESVFDEVLGEHLVSDVGVTGLLSGGVDSTLVALKTDLDEYYTVGLDDANEFDDVAEFAEAADKHVRYILLSRAQLEANWETLTRKRREPLSVPNEGLIYGVCRTMPADTKVVLTGEGADELMFGYDRIFRRMSSAEATLDDFFNSYCYSDHPVTERVADYVEERIEGKTLLEFCEDFFIDFHLPGLLRRMDVSMMAASKEGRVPFVDHRLFELMYRKPLDVRMPDTETKVLLRSILDSAGYRFVSKREKIGFSAVGATESRDSHYRKFQEMVLGALGW